MFVFVPHCTMLYNTSLPDGENFTAEKDDIENGCEKNNTRLRMQGENMLKQCLENYHNQQRKQAGTKHSANASNNNSNSTLSNTISSIKLIPTSHYYFPYPKAADDGKGFGCCISMLIFETTPELSSLQEAIKRTFPPDERHGGGKSGNDGDERSEKNEQHSSTTSDNDSAIQHQMQQNEQTSREEVKFQPHMALCYAPEAHENVVNGWLEEYTAQMEREQRFVQWCSDTSSAEATKITQSCSDTEQNEGNQQEKLAASWNAKYLSLWSTKGSLEEWFCLAKLDLMTSYS